MAQSVKSIRCVYQKRPPHMYTVLNNVLLTAEKQFAQGREIMYNNISSKIGECFRSIFLEQNLSEF